MCYSPDQKNPKKYIRNQVIFEIFQKKCLDVRQSEMHARTRKRTRTRTHTLTEK